MTGISRPIGSLPAIERLVQELDEKAWDLHDVDIEQYPDAFAAARAANAWLYLSPDPPFET